MKRVSNAPPRREEALAIIIERIARDGVSPSLEDIGRAMRPPVGISRAGQLVDQLVARKMVERRPGAQRRLVVRDVAHSRLELEQVCRRLGWTIAEPMGPLQHPCPHFQLPMLPAFDDLPDIQ